jgi:Ser/Thr protein kinase RdoA (MazF antagonist)
MVYSLIVALQNGDPAHEAEITLLNDLGVVLRPPGIDEKLFGLSLLRNPERIAREIEMAGGPALGAVTRTELLAHRLGKRAVFRIRLAAPGRTSGASVILKLYRLRSPQCGFVSGLLQRLLVGGFGRAHPIRVPEVITVLQSLAALIMEDTPGVPVAELEGNAASSANDLAGRALARVHAQPFRPLNNFGPADELALLSQWVSLIEALDPRQARDFRQALFRVQRRLEQCRAFEPALIHRDFHQKQVLVADGRAVLIDFDTAASGDPAQDIGNYLAHLRLRELQGAAHRGEQAAAFLDGYAREKRLPELASREAHFRSTLLRLACMYALTTRWRRLCGSLLELV